MKRDTTHERKKVKSTNFRMTETGPIAEIDGKWYSVNGTRDDIIDVRFEVPAPKDTTPELHVGVIPDIFGYGMTVVETSQAKAEAALRAKYAEWKADQAKHFPWLDTTETTFEGSFENFGGYYKRIEPGKVYFDNFAE